MAQQYMSTACSSRGQDFQSMHGSLQSPETPVPGALMSSSAGTMHLFTDIQAGKTPTHRKYTESE